ncbi:MAG: glucose 1-dehydrogenase [Balneolales bacterium]
MSKTVIITGAANGIGKTIASAFASRGFHVIIADIDTENGINLQDQLAKEDGQARFVECDVSDPEAIRNLVRNTVDIFDGIDIIINNAGLSEFTQPKLFTVDSWDHILNTNLRSSFLLTREAAPIMRKMGGGSVVNIASTRALMSEKNSEAYAASKGGLLALTHAMALSYADDHIRVNSISPGWIHTGDDKELREVDHHQHPSGRVGKPADIARACLFLTHPDNDFINGENLVIDGGMTRKMIYQH